MPLNKFASFGQLPPSGAVVSGLATIVNQQLGTLAGQAPLGPRLDGLRDSIGALAAAMQPLVAVPKAVTAAAASNKLGFDAVAAEIDKLNRIVGKPREPAGTPSADAFLIVAALGQIGDALCDLRKPTLANTNQLIARAGRSTSIRFARERLADETDLAQELEDQLEQLDPDVDFEAQRRLRLAQLVALQAKVLARVGDSSPSTSDS